MYSVCVYTACFTKQHLIMDVWKRQISDTLQKTILKQFINPESLRSTHTECVAVQYKGLQRNILSYQWYWSLKPKLEFHFKIEVS